MSNKDKITQDLNSKIFNLKLSKLNKDLELLKKSYPNFSDGMFIPGQHNMEKWIQTLKDVYYNQHQGLDWKQALDQSTKNWLEPEKMDFINWVRFYQEGAHKKYAKLLTAQDNNWYFSPDEDKSDYFIPNAISTQNSKDSIGVNRHSDWGNIDQVEVDDISPAEKKKIAEKQRKKIISRLDSIEKLIRSDEGHLLTESEFDSLMESIYSLKKKISTLKKKTSGSLFYKDLIVREANVLAKNGLYKAASFLYVAADSQAAPSAAPSPSPTEGKTDGGGLGLPGTIPASGPAAGAPMANTPGTDPSANVVPSVEPSKGEKTVTQDGMSQPNISSGILGFVQEMNNSDDGIDDNFVDELLIFDDGEDESDFDIQDELLVTEAQAADLAPVSPPVSPPASPAPTVERNFEDRLDDLLGKATIEDVVIKLEEISKVFKTREIPRQLTVVDMMLDRLGLATFFPTLSEAINKSLESNNYVLTRIDGILSELTGAIKSKDMDLLPRESPVAPEVETIKGNLEEKEKMDKARKEMRQELANKALEERSKEEAPELEVTEEELPLATETPSVPAAAPATVAPPAAAATPASPPV